MEDDNYLMNEIYPGSMCQTCGDTGIIQMDGGDDCLPCPDCGESPLIDKTDYLECSSCNKKWEFKDGIYDFRESIKN